MNGNAVTKSSESIGTRFSVSLSEANPQLPSGSSFLAKCYLRPNRTLGTMDAEIPALCFGKEVVPLFDFTKPIQEVRMVGGKTTRLEFHGLDLVGILGGHIAVFNASIGNGRFFPVGRGINLDSPREKSRWMMFGNLDYHSVRASAVSDSGFIAGEVIEELGYAKRLGLFRATADHFYLIHGSAGQTLHVHHINDNGEMAIVANDGPYLQAVGGRINLLMRNGHGEDVSIAHRAGDFPIIGTVDVMGQKNLAFWYPHNLRVDISWTRSAGHISQALNPRGLLTQGDFGTDLLVLGNALFEERDAKRRGIFGFGHKQVKLTVPFCMAKRGVGESFADLHDLVDGLSPTDRILSVVDVKQIDKAGYVLVHVNSGGNSSPQNMVLKTTLT